RQPVDVRAYDEDARHRSDAVVQRSHFVDPTPNRDPGFCQHLLEGALGPDHVERLAAADAPPPAVEQAELVVVRLGAEIEHGELTQYEQSTEPLVLRDQE